MSNWTNNGVDECKTCGITFKVYGFMEEPEVSFCPICGSSNIKPAPEDIKD